jgi:hypothetical protein
MRFRSKTVAASALIFAGNSVKTVLQRATESMFNAEVVGHLLERPEKDRERRVNHPQDWQRHSSENRVDDPL